MPIVLDIAANRLEAWTHSEAGAVDLAKFVTPRLTQFPTFDRTDGQARQMPVYIYEPSTPGSAPGADRLARRPGIAIPPRLRSLAPVRGQRTGIRRGCTQCARLLRLRKNLPGARQRHAARRRRQGRRRAAGVAQPAKGLRREACGGVRRGPTAAICALATLVNFGERLRGGVDMARHPRLRQLSDQYRAVPPRISAARNTATSAIPTCGPSCGAFHR